MNNLIKLCKIKNNLKKYKMKLNKYKNYAFLRLKYTLSHGK